MIHLVIQNYHSMLEQIFQVNCFYMSLLNFYMCIRDLIMKYSFLLFASLSYYEGSVTKVTSSR